MVIVTPSSVIVKDHNNKPGNTEGRLRLRMDVESDAFSLL